MILSGGFVMTLVMMVHLVPGAADKACIPQILPVKKAEDLMEE